MSTGSQAIPKPSPSTTLAIAVGALLLAAPALSGPVKIGPLRLNLGPRARVAAVTLSNQGVETMNFQARVETWTQNDGGDQQAVCHYKYDAVDDTAVTLANPIEAYATSPSKMALNERTLTGAELAQLVKRAMQKQGRAFVDRARETLRGQ